MKKLITLLTLTLLATSAHSWTCYQYMDKDGFKRYKCGETTDAATREAWKQHVQSAPTVKTYKVRKASPSGSFTVYDRSSGTYTHCNKSLTGAVECQ